MADISIKQGGWAGLNLSPGVGVEDPEAKSDTNPLTTCAHMYYIHPRLAVTHPKPQRRNQTPREAHPTHPRTQRLSPSQRPPRRPAAQAKVAISSSPPGPVPPSLTTRRWKTPWTVLKSLLTEQPDPWSGTGQPVAEDRSALRPLPQIKLDCPPLPAPGYRRRTGYPLLLRGELTLDFPLPAPAYGGQRSQPSLEPMTDDGPVRPTILPGLGGGGDPSHAPGTPPCPHYLKIGSRIQQASFIATSPPHQTKPKPPTHN